VPPGSVRGFVIPEAPRPVLVANVGGRFVATVSVCPHGRQSLLSGYLAGTRIMCPGHAFEFDLETGACIEDQTLRLSRYRLAVAGGNVFVARDPANAKGLLAT
jgi:nitrite reductase/ring-hydroxylating ferredoxin subunit